VTTSSPTRYTQEELERLDIDVLDRLAFGVTGGELVTLRPDQIRIKYACDLANPEAKLARGGLAWARSVDLSEPVEVSVAEDGGFDLEDGHHRWMAAGQTHRPLTAVIEIKGNPIRRLLWLQEHGQPAAQSTAKRTRRPR
jgi:hypothetical protein